jgi:sporulation protein YlmC with PRC-barrel domain
MNRNLLGGAALAAVMAATPALAQQPNDTLCVLTGLNDRAAMSERVASLDTDRDGRITREEYVVCLDANVAEGERQRYLDEFASFDRDRDAVLVIAEIEAAGGSATGGQAAQVRVEEQPANVTVQQPAPTVRVDQAQPQVAVQQPEPQVAVQQREPEVRVEQRQPVVSVQQPEPEISVEQPEAEVAIQQAQPQVEMNVPPPEVEVRQAQPQVRVEQREPQVSVEQPEPEVRVEQAEANVQVETEEARVVVEQAEPQVEIQRVTSPEVAPARQSAATSGEATQQASAAGMTDATDVDAVAVVPVTAGLPFDDIEGEEAYNNAGQEIGEISDVVMEQATGNLFVVLAAGGFLGLGETEIVFPYESVSMRDDLVVIDTNITEGQVEERQDYDASRYVEVPEDRVVR